MYFQESELLLSQFHQNDIEKVDSYLNSSLGAFIDSHKVSYHTKISQPKVSSILACYRKAGLLVSTDVLECNMCQHLLELQGPEQAVCDSCDQIIDLKNGTKQSVLKVVEVRSGGTKQTKKLALSACSKTILEDLKDAIKSRDVVFLVGAGASVNATENAQASSWKGFLKLAVSHCKDVAGDLLTPAWIEIVEKELESNEVDAFLSVAEKVTSKLSKSNELKRFFCDTVGKLEIHDSTLLDAITAFDLPVMTTNYDSLLEVSSKLPSISWFESSKVDDWIRGKRKAILHVHGHWDTDPDKIIFGHSSYARIIADNRFQTMLRTIRGCKNVIYLCFGNSLEDPHFSSFFKWGAEFFSDTNSRNFKFCLNDTNALSKVEIDNRIVKVVYGEEYADLATFLAELKVSIEAKTNET